MSDEEMRFDVNRWKEMHFKAIIEKNLALQEEAVSFRKTLEKKYGMDTAELVAFSDGKKKPDVLFEDDGVDYNGKGI